MVLVVQGASPYKTLADLIAAARAHPGELAFASGGPGSSLHIAIEVLRRAANIDINYVPFGGTAPAVATLLGGHVAAVWADYPTVVAQLQAGTLRGLVTTSRSRVETLPDVPTFAETGVSNYEADIFYGLVAPAKTPDAKLAQLSKTFAHRAESAGDEVEARQGGIISGRHLRRRIRRLHEKARRRLRAHHRRGAYQDGVTASLTPPARW